MGSPTPPSWLMAKKSEKLEKCGFKHGESVVSSTNHFGGRTDRRTEEDNWYSKSLILWKRIIITHSYVLSSFNPFPGCELLAAPFIVAIRLSLKVSERWVGLHTEERRAQEEGGQGGLHSGTCSRRSPLICTLMHLMGMVVRSRSS
jgi:hypothetical protein